MRGLFLVAMVVGTSATATAERRRNDVVPASCSRMAAQLGSVAGLDAPAQSVLTRRCERDRWSRDVQMCFAQAATSADASVCIDRLTKPQRIELEGDVDRAGNARLARLVFRRSLPTAIAAPMSLVTGGPAMATGAPIVTLAAFDVSHGDMGRARLLHTQGLSAYQAGRYDFAIRKFIAALDVSETPELVYHLAQAYRLKGDRARALDHYERYVELAPEGPAANACRSQIEHLRDSLP